LLSFDELATRINAAKKAELPKLLDEIWRDGKTILKIEHGVRLLMGLCNHITAFGGYDVRDNVKA
jgi:branched-chain amino acid transport system ATP-binding protein